MRRYLYIDEDQLADYEAQFPKKISGYAGRSSWKVKLGFGVGEIEAGSPSSDTSMISRLEAVEKALKQRGVVLSGRPVDPFEPETVQFCEEIMTAQKGVLKRKELLDEGVKALTIWFSRSSTTNYTRAADELARTGPGPLVLLQTNLVDANQPSLTSGYGWLNLLLQTISEDFEADNKSVLRDTFAQELHAAFAIDPRGTLSEIGVQFGPEQSIGSLFRIRACGLDGRRPDNMDKFETLTIGYPLFVAS